jgi:hypothetical protein
MTLHNCVAVGSRTRPGVDPKETTTNQRKRAQFGQHRGADVLDVERR